MTRRLETLSFSAVLASLLVGLFFDSLVGGQILSPADVLRVQPGFATPGEPPYEPKNRLLMDPVLQFQPWMEWNRRCLSAGELPLWNPYVGCGAPHLANGQSAVFDPFQSLIHPLGVPRALAWMAFGRLFTAGLGMFLLGWSWRLERSGRWFAGLAFPFCGFLIGWLQYPVTNVAIWLPWLLWCTDRVLERSSPARVAQLALVAAAAALGGHVQTTAQVYLACLLGVVWRLLPGAASQRPGARQLAAWGAGLTLGVGIAAIELVPLGFYLARSPVWEERQREHGGPGELTRPRLLDAACTAAPYLYGSQRRGHPNLARALGVNNVNEAAGGYVSLVALLVLAPLGSRRGPDPSVGSFLVTLGLVGALTAFDIPPFRNLLRVVPVLNVMDQRRLVLWVAFAVTMLAGRGVDRLRTIPFGGGRILQFTAIGVGVMLLALSFVPTVVPASWWRSRIEPSYQRLVERGELDPATGQALADRQLRNLQQFAPAYLRYLSAQLLLLASLSGAIGRHRISGAQFRSALLALVALDLGLFAYGVNPEIDAEEHQLVSPWIHRLRESAAFPDRVLGIGDVLPPNTAQRYGLADCRNYDSVELRTNLDWFEPIYEPADRPGARSSRRTVSWQSAARGLDRLRAADVTLLVGATPPPRELFPASARLGNLWLVQVPSEPGARPWHYVSGHEIRIDGHSESSHRRIRIPVTRTPGWIALEAGRPLPIDADPGPFLTVRPRHPAAPLQLLYQPAEVTWALRVSATALILALGLLVAKKSWNLAGKTGLRGVGALRLPWLESS